MNLAVILLLAVSSQFADLSRQAAAARESNQVDKAVQLYRECVRVQPAWAEGWWYLATLLYDRNDFGAAEEAFAHSVKIDPKSAPGWAMLGLCEFQTRQFERALQHLQKGLTLGLGGNPQIESVSRYHTALLLTHFGEFEPALQVLMQLAAEGSDDPNTIAACGTAALRMPLLPAELASKLTADKREIVVQVGHAVYDTGAHRAAQAKREFDDLALKYPLTPEIHYLYGGFLLLGDSDAGIRELKRELEISPRHVAARMQLAYEYLKQGEAAAGLPYAEQAVELDPDSFVARNALGRLLVETGDLKRGIGELERARELAPQSPENRVALASAYAKAGRKEDASRERAEFLRLKKERNPSDQP